MSESDTYVTGIDGGGTKTEAWVARLVGSGAPEVLGRGLSGSSNPRAVSMETAISNLGAAVEAAWREAGRTPFMVDAAVLAIAGTSHPAAAQRVREWAAEKRLAREVRLVHDADPVLAAGTPAGVGVALVIGTGSSAVAADSAGNKAIVGGWGYWFGDEGSGYWIGREGLRVVARAADNRAAPTTLTESMSAHLGVANPRALLGALERKGEVRRAIAELAAIVCTAAEAGDGAATVIIGEAAVDLADLVAAAARKLNLGDRFPLALAGGVACRSGLLRDRLAAALAARGITPTQTTQVPHPAAGCVKLAAGITRA